LHILAFKLFHKSENQRCRRQIKLQKVDLATKLIIIHPRVLSTLYLSTRPCVSITIAIITLIIFYPKKTLKSTTRECLWRYNIWIVVFDVMRADVIVIARSVGKIDTVMSTYICHLLKIFVGNLMHKQIYNT